MSEKRFDVVLNEFDEIEYITDIVDCEDRDFADFIDFANEMAEENERLKKENEDLEAFRYNVFKSMDKARVWREKKSKIRKNF